MSADPLLQPFRLKTVELRNRIVSTSHEPGYAEAGMPTDRYRAYHREKARGGVGLTMIGGSAVVSPDSPASFGNLHLYDDAVVSWLRKLADEVHEEGAAVTCQLTHLGHRTSNYTASWLPAVSVDNLREPAHRAFTKRADLDDLRRIAADFAAAAQRCEAAGLDGVEIMGHGHLLDAFLSPDLNTRDDEFGGSLENRLRFPLMVVDAVTAAVRPEFVVGVRTGADERRRGGLEEPEGIAIIQRLVAAGLDFVSVNRGHIATEDGLSQLIPPMGEASAPHLAAAARIKDAVDVPIMHGSKIADLATARHAVAEGLIDLVGMTRAMIADPQLVRRLEAGEEDRVRPCVGASLCIDAPYTGESAFCIHNASTGRELALPHRIAPASAPRDAVVVGAGPAGLEAARVLAERGHHVTVLEASDGPGGLVRLASRVPRRRDLIGIVDWRVAECRRLGVEFRYHTVADADDVRALGADLVVVATGGLADTAFLERGADLVTETVDVIGGAVRPRGSVLVYDDNGSHPALDVVELLAKDHPSVATIEYLTPERTVGPEVGSVNAPPYLRTFVEHDVRTTLLFRLEGVERHDGRLRATFRSEVGDVRTERVVDTVVVERGTLPNDEVFHDLAAASSNGGVIDPARLLALGAQAGAGDGFQLFRVGDAVSSRNVHAAVIDSFRLCSAL